MSKKIQLTKGKFALIDDDDFQKVSKFNWYASQNRNKFYAVRGRKNKIIMHRFIINAPKGKIVDHINGNGLDNRKSNLRICTNSENLMNSSKYKGNFTSIYKGVYKFKKKKPSHRQLWGASIRKNSKMIYIGSFKTEIEAAKAYNTVALEHFGEFAKLNKL